jgi:Ras-related protein Rab-2A
MVENSALKGGETRDDLLSRLLKMQYEILDAKETQQQDFLFKLIIIGDSAVGKSCLMHRVTTNDFVEDHEVTVGVEFGTLLVKLQEQIFKLQIWDTAGQESFKSITKIFYRGAHCVVLAYDITRMDTFLNLENWFNEVT